MRVLHLLDSLNRGGAETMLLDVCRNAARTGLELTFVASGGGDLEEQFRDSGAEFIRLQRKFPMDLALVRRLRRIVRERSIDVVHGHQPVEALHLYLATRGSATKRVLTLHGSYAGAKNEMALKFVLPRMDARIAVSEDAAKRLVTEQGIDARMKFVTVDNGVDPQRICPAGTPRLRDELNVGKNGPLLGMVGNFYADGRKDQLTVCKALPKVLARFPEAAFVFAGAKSDSAPDRFDECVAFCRAQGLAGRVHFLGKRSDIPDVLRSLDAFVLSSFWEGSPIAVMEAMMMGVPAVLSDIGSLREVSGDGAYAVLFRAGDHDDLAEKLIGLLQEPQRRVRLAADAKEFALSRFGIDQHIKSLLRVYARLVA